LPWLIAYLLTSFASRVFHLQLTLALQPFDPLQQLVCLLPQAGDCGRESLFLPNFFGTRFVCCLITASPLIMATTPVLRQGMRMISIRISLDKN